MYELYTRAGHAWYLKSIVEQLNASKVLLLHATPHASHVVQSMAGRADSVLD
jgi:hypothetical protein